MKIQLLGHCTVVLETENSQILLDPYFGVHGNPLYRRCEQAMPYQAGGKKLEGILVSHSHWDHMDMKFLRQHKNEVPIYAPKLSLKAAFVNARSVKKGKAFELGEFIITPVQAWHFCPAVGYMIEAEGQTVYFSGDTFYGGFLKVLGDKFKVDVALMGVTRYIPPMTMGSHGACKAARDLGARVVIPIHQDIMPRIQPNNTKRILEGLKGKMKKVALASQVVLLKNGEVYRIK